VGVPGLILTGQAVSSTEHVPPSERPLRNFVRSGTLMYRYELLSVLEEVVKALSKTSPDYVNNPSHLGITLTEHGEPVNNYQALAYMINAYENDQNATIVIHAYPSPQAKRKERNEYLKNHGLSFDINGNPKVKV
jgi:hypothetical protein